MNVALSQDRACHATFHSTRGVGIGINPTVHSCEELKSICSEVMLEFFDSGLVDEMTKGSQELGYRQASIGFFENLEVVQVRVISDVLPTIGIELSQSGYTNRFRNDRWCAFKCLVVLAEQCSFRIFLSEKSHHNFPSGNLVVLLLELFHSSNLL